MSDVNFSFIVNGQKSTITPRKTSARFTTPNGLKVEVSVKSDTETPYASREQIPLATSKVPGHITNKTEQRSTENDFLSKIEVSKIVIWFKEPYMMKHFAEDYLALNINKINEVEETSKDTIEFNRRILHLYMDYQIDSKKKFPR